MKVHGCRAVLALLLAQCEVVIFDPLEDYLQVGGVVVLPVKVSDHDIVTVVQHPRDAGDNLCYLCVEDVFTVQSTKCESLVATVTPWCREGHDLSGLLVQEELVIAVEVEFAEYLASFEPSDEQLGYVLGVYASLIC